MRLPNPMNAATRLRAALTDPARAERGVIVALVVYALLWAVYGAIAKSSQGLHYDMTEVIAWSRDLAWGYLKHPPVAAAVVWAWFEIFPVTDFTYYLLAMAMPALTLWIVWRLSADYLDFDKRVAGLALLMLIPFFNFHALKFNVNTVQMPLWAATTWWFLRAYRTRGTGYAALAGVGAALCMMSKYWSVFLLIGLIAAALIDKRRAAYFKSAAPWITVIAGLLALSPHLWWLKTHDFAPFTYAMGIHGDKPFGGTVIAALGYLAGSIAYVALPVILVLAVIYRSSPRRRGPSAAGSENDVLDSRLRGNQRRLESTISDLVWPHDEERRLAAAAFWMPFLLPALGAVATGTEITSLWSMAAWTLLPVLLLSSPTVAWRALDTSRVLLLAMALPVVMLIASPAIAIMVQRDGPRPAEAQAALLAQQIHYAWRAMTPLPLRFVGGDEGLTYAVIAASADRPRALAIAAPDDTTLRHGGAVLVCFAEDKACKDQAAKADGQLIESTVVRNFWRFPGKPQKYTIVLVPPRM